MFGEWYQKTNKIEDTNKLTLLAFKIIAILHNTLLATFINLLETVFRNRLQNPCHTFLDCRHVCKTCTFRDALQAEKKKEVHRTPLIWRPQAIQECVTAVLLSILKEAFADSFQKLYERCQQCVVKDGNYFEGQ
jgi:hypothetical protein